MADSIKGMLEHENTLMRDKLAKEACTKVGHVRMEGRGEPGCRGWEGEGAGWTLGEEGRWEGEGRPGGVVGQPGQQGGGGGHALAGHRQHRPGEERVGALLLDHLVVLSPPFGLAFGITTGVNLHSRHQVRYQRASSFFKCLSIC